MTAQPLDRIAEREAARPRPRAGSTDGSSDVECAPRAERDPLDQRRPEVACGPVRPPTATPRARRGSRCRRHAAPGCRSPKPRSANVADAPRAKSSGVEIAHWLLTMLRITGAWYVDANTIAAWKSDSADGALADPRRRDRGAAAHRRRHRPSDRLDVLRGEVAGDREEAVRLRRVHHRELAALQRVVRRWTAPGSSCRRSDSRRRSAGPAGGRSGSACRRAAAPAAGRTRSPPRRATACRTRSCPAGGRAASGRRSCARASCRAARCSLSATARSGTHSPTALPSSSSTRTSCLRISATRSTFSSSAGFFISPALLMKCTRSAGW